MKTLSKKTRQMPLAMAATCLSCAIVFYCLILPARAAEPTPETPGDHVSIDFDNVDIRIFIKFISKLTNKNFVVDSRVKGNVTVISPTRISKTEAYQVFESVLGIHGFTTVAAGKVIKILPQSNARGDNVDTRIITGRETPRDRIATRIIPLEYADANQIKGLLAPLLPKGSVILSYRDTNMLVVTAPLSSIERLMKIITPIDVPNIGRKISVIQIRHADAKKLVNNLTTVFRARTKVEKGKPSTDLLVQFVADERTNTIILLANRVETERVKQLIYLLDKQIPKGDERIRVYYLEHALAEDLANVLKDIPKDKGAVPKQAGKKEMPLLSREVHITADKTTNSLVIMADKEDYPVLEEVIGKLDIPRAMVYIECLIMEVNVAKGLNIGTEWQAAQTFDGGSKAGFGGFNSGALDNINDVQGFSMGVLGKTFEIGGVTFPNIQAVVQAYQKDKDVNILSTPQILTTENQEATITVGKNVPYQTRSAAETGTETYSSYEYKDVGITLKITPQISQDRLVRLNVFQELTKLDDVNTTEGTDRPTTFKRQIETTIIVEDSNSVVIGGLIDDVTTTTEYRTPCLGDIPFLGWAFKRVEEGQEKTNLYVFITPKVIKNPLEAGKIYTQKKGELDADMKSGEILLYDKIENLRERTIGGEKDTSPAQ